MKNKSYQTGMTLIEIMIALLIGVFLLGGVINIFINSKQTYRMQEGLSRLQENGRFAMEFLAKDIRLAGFMGCSSVTATNPVVIANNPLVAPNPHLGIPAPAVVQASTITGGDNNIQNNPGPPPTGSFASPSPALSTSPLNGVLVGTDAITVQFGESCGGYSSAATTSVNPTGIIAAGNTCGINLGTGATFATIGTPLIISDCSSAHVFRASAGTSQNKDAVPAGAGAATSILIGKAAPGYAAGSEIMLFRSYTYFLQLGASGQPALWRLDNNKPVLAGSNPEELIEGIENMQTTYGVDTDAAGAVGSGTPNYYVSANNVAAADWPKVVSIRISLLAATVDDNLTAQPVPYTYNGVTTTTTSVPPVTDRRIRRVFNTTIAIRNRLP